jgi:two-component system response regulator YesN
MVKNEFIRNSLEYIQQNVLEHLSLNKVAERAHMSVSRFSHLFKKETGTTFVGYCNELRIARAKILLCSSSYKSSVIAKMAGFEDESYFIRVFRLYTGLTPLQFRGGAK